ncbi:MAG: hypothetical protein R2778_18680 [Saprospiraceae bacterium]
MQAGLLLAQSPQELRHLASYESGSADVAEVVAFDPAKSRIFHQQWSKHLTIVDISVPSAPVFYKEVDLSTYGGGVNSVAVADGTVAVAVKSTTNTANGAVLFFNTDGDFQS